MHRHSPALRRLGALFLLLTTCSASAVPPARPTPSGELSVLELPLDFSLQPLFDAVERQVPREAGHWRDWQRRLGIQTRYRAWRGPLGLAIQGDTLTLRAHVRYWVQARAPLLGELGLTTGCGLEEAPRQALIGLQARLQWGPDWRLHPSFRILPTQFLDRCELTLANIDVTPLVGGAFRVHMQRSLRQAINSLGPTLQGLQAQARELWQGLNRPLSLGAAGWLMLHPQAVALSPLEGLGDRARLNLAVALRPTLRMGQSPQVRIPPLPPLQPLPPGATGLRFDLSLHLDYGDLGTFMTHALKDREFQVRGHRFGIRTLVASHQEDDLHLRLVLSGEAAGEAELWVRPGFDADAGTLRIETLDYVIRPEDPDLYDLSLMFYEQIRQALVASAEHEMQQDLDQVREQLEKVLREIAPHGVSLDMGGLSLRRLDISLGADGLALRGEAAGSLHIRSQD